MKSLKHIHTRKGRKIRSDSTKSHHHPSHPYSHPEGRAHLYGPKSRIPDRKGRKFRGKADRRTPHRKGKIGTRRGRKKRWD